jgi:hypothetical protein
MGVSSIYAYILRSCDQGMDSSMEQSRHRETAGPHAANGDTSARVAIASVVFASAFQDLLHTTQICFL